MRTFFFILLTLTTFAVAEEHNSDEAIPPARPKKQTSKKPSDHSVEEWVKRLGNKNFEDREEASEILKSIVADPKYCREVIPKLKALAKNDEQREENRRASDIITKPKIDWAKIILKATEGIQKDFSNPRIKEVTQQLLKITKMPQYAQLKADGKKLYQQTLKPFDLSTAQLEEQNKLLEDILISLKPSLELAGFEVIAVDNPKLELLRSTGGIKTPKASRPYGVSSSVGCVVKFKDKYYRLDYMPNNFVHISLVPDLKTPRPFLDHLSGTESGGYGYGDNKISEGQKKQAKEFQDYAKKIPQEVTYVKEVDIEKHFPKNCLDDLLDSQTASWGKRQYEHTHYIHLDSGHTDHTMLLKPNSSYSGFSPYGSTSSSSSGSGSSVSTSSSTSGYYNPYTSKISFGNSSEDLAVNYLLSRYGLYATDITKAANALNVSGFMLNMNKPTFIRTIPNSGNGFSY